MEKQDLVKNYNFFTSDSIDQAVQIGKLSQAIFGLGCFWGPDANFGSMAGVVQTRVGYAGSKKSEPNYQNLKGHAEVVRVYYDKNYISSSDLLGNFEYWNVTDRNRNQYRPLLFIFDKEQRAVIDSLLLKIGKNNAPEIFEAGQLESYFWAAESYHQKHKLRNNKKLIDLIESEYGEKWDEHLYFTKLNSDGRKGFDIKQWVGLMPEKIQKAYRLG